MQLREETAFPIQLATGVSLGMTLRDYFAAQVMQNIDWKEEESFTWCANLCYEVADAMMEARK